VRRDSFSADVLGVSTARRDCFSAGDVTVSAWITAEGPGCPLKLDLRHIIRWRWPAGAVDTLCTPSQQRGLVPYPEATGHQPAGDRVSRLGSNALGEALEPGRVPDCYLGLRLDPAADAQATGC
jgi:hypothetical protein